MRLTRNGTLRAGSIAVAFLATTAATSLAKDFGGEWNTSEGQATLTQRGSEVAGTYSQDNGRIGGTASGNHFSGYWGEDGSAEKCGTAKLGTSYWGRLEWDLVEDGNSLRGKWSYCDKEPSGTWSGARTGEAPEDNGDNGDHGDNGQPEGWNVPGGGEAQVTSDNFNKARCNYSDFATIEADRPMFLSKFQLWVDWDKVPENLHYRVSLDGENIGGGTLSKGSCDPYQTHWCHAQDSPNVKLPPGTYRITLDTDAICQNAGSNGEGFVRVFDP